MDFNLLPDSSISYSLPCLPHRAPVVCFSFYSRDDLSLKAHLYVGVFAIATVRRVVTVGISGCESGRGEGFEAVL